MQAHPQPGEGQISSALETVAGASVSTLGSHRDRPGWGLLCRRPCPLPMPTYLHLHHPVHQDGTHVPTDVWLLLHVVREYEFLLPRYELVRDSLDTTILK